MGEKSQGYHESLAFTHLDICGRSWGRAAGWRAVAPPCRFHRFHRFVRRQLCTLLKWVGHALRNDIKGLDRQWQGSSGKEGRELWWLNGACRVALGGRAGALMCIFWDGMGRDKVRWGWEWTRARVGVGVGDGQTFKTHLLWLQAPHGLRHILETNRRRNGRRCKLTGICRRALWGTALAKGDRRNYFLRIAHVAQLGVSLVDVCTRARLASRVSGRFGERFRTHPARTPNGLCGLPLRKHLRLRHCSQQLEVCRSGWGLCDSTLTDTSLRTRYLHRRLKPRQPTRCEAHAHCRELDGSVLLQLLQLLL